MAKKLLIADDSKTIRTIVKLALVNQEFEVIETDNGNEAFSKAKDLIPDLILADLFMPGKDGYELCRLIKQEPSTSNIPVLLFSGKNRPFDPKKSEEVGADGHIIKPFITEEFLKTLKETLDKASLPKISIGEIPKEEIFEEEPIIFEEEEAKVYPQVTSQSEIEEEKIEIDIEEEVKEEKVIKEALEEEYEIEEEYKEETFNLTEAEEEKEYEPSYEEEEIEVFETAQEDIIEESEEREEEVDITHPGIDREKLLKEEEVEATYQQEEPQIVQQEEEEEFEVTYQEEEQIEAESKEYLTDEIKIGTTVETKEEEIVEKPSWIELADKEAKEAITKRIHEIIEPTLQKKLNEHLVKIISKFEPNIDEIIKEVIESKIDRYFMPSFQKILDEFVTTLKHKMNTLVPHIIEKIIENEIPLKIEEIIMKEIPIEKIKKNLISSVQELIKKSLSQPLE